MAIIHINNADGISISIPYEIIPEKVENLADVSGDYSIDNNLMRQKITISNNAGLFNVSYPVRFKNQVTSVMINNCKEELKEFVRVSYWDETKFTVRIMYNTFDSEEKITFIAVGH